jgi:multidrug resistance protein
MDGSPPKKTDAAKLTVLMVTAFMDMVGVLMVVPLLPFFVKDMGAGGLVVGLLVSSFSVAQLLMAPVWGRMSDHYGRRPALLIGLGASAIAFVIFAFANSLWLLFLMRLVQGAGGGTVSVIQAYVADALEPKDRAKGLGWLSAATNAGVALGPVMGGVALTYFGRKGPGLMAAALCVINMAFMWRFLRESRDMTEAAASRAKPKVPGASRAAVWRVASHPAEPASRLIWIYAIAIGAFQGITSILALYLGLRYGVTAHTIGYFFAYIGVISIVARAVILGKAVDYFGEAKLARFGSTLLALGLGLLPFMRPATNPLLTYAPLALAVALLPLGTAFTFPCVTALLSRVVPSNERGLYMGVQQTFGGASRVLFPIVYGFLFDRIVEAPFLLGAALVVFTIYLGRSIVAPASEVAPKSAL